MGPITMTEPQAGNGKPINGKHVAIGFFILFVVVASVNAGFIMASLNSFSGLTSENAYYDGLDYNQVLEASAAQQERGWISNVTASNGQLQVDLMDRQEQALGGLTVTAIAMRRANDHDDVPLSLVEIAPGRYAADFTFPVKGQWDIDLRARLGDQLVYRLNHYYLAD